MTDLLIDGSIDKSIYDAKQREVMFRKAELDQRLQQVDSPEQGDPDALNKLVAMTSRSAEIFASSKTEEKRLMLGFVFSNLALEGASLRYSLRKPFNHLQQVPKNPEWRAVQDDSMKWELIIPVRPKKQGAAKLSTKSWEVHHSIASQNIL